MELERCWESKRLLLFFCIQQVLVLFFVSYFIRFSGFQLYIKASDSVSRHFPVVRGSGSFHRVSIGNTSTLTHSYTQQRDGLAEALWDRDRVAVQPSGGWTIIVTDRRLLTHSTAEAEWLSSCEGGGAWGGRGGGDFWSKGKHWLFPVCPTLELLSLSSATVHIAVEQLSIGTLWDSLDKQKHNKDVINI